MVRGQKHWGVGLVVMLSLLLILAACGEDPVVQESRPTAVSEIEPSPVAATAVIAPTATPEASVVATSPTATSLPPTATPVPPTPTLRPTNTPVPPTATPVPPTAIPVPPTATTGPVQLPPLDNRTSGVLAYEDGSDIWVLSLPEGMRRQLTRDSTGSRLAFPGGFNRNPVWSPDGQTLAFASVRDLYQQDGYGDGYEVYTMRPDGSNLRRVTDSPDGRSVQRLPLAWFSTGDILIGQVDTRPASTLPRLALLDPNSGKLKDLPVKDSNLTNFAISPDGRQIAYTLSKPDTRQGYNKVDLYVAALNGSGARMITNLPAGPYLTVSALAWSPDGQTVAFSQGIGDSCGAYTLYTVRRDGSSLRKLHNADGIPRNLSYAPGGKWLAYSTADCITGPVLRLLDSERVGPPIELTEGAAPTYTRKIAA